MLGVVAVSNLTRHFILPIPTGALHFYLFVVSGIGMKPRTEIRLEWRWASAKNDHRAQISVREHPVWR
jgi:hypothetical protein